MTGLSERIVRAEASLRPRLTGPIEIGLILGSGLSGVADTIASAQSVPYAEIDAFPRSTVAGHAGRLVVGMLAGRRVAAMQGRFHLYEGWAADDIKLPVYLLRRLGARVLIATNAAGGLNPDFKPGEIALISDHLNFMGANPLAGANDESIGPRFPDMSDVYDRALRGIARDAARSAGVALREGVYAAVLGPSYETSAERRFLRLAGGDLIGMSTVPEVIAAKHCGMRVLGFSIVTNAATGGADQAADSHAQVLRVAEAAGERLAALLPAIVAKI